MNTFLGHESTFWTGVEAIAICVYTLIITITLWFIYRQVRIAAKAFQLGAIRRLQELVDDFREDRRRLFSMVPLKLALSQDQFPKRPPGLHRLRRLSEGEIRRMALTEEQTTLLQSLDLETLELARRIIGRLNDIGQLVEGGFINRRVIVYPKNWTGD